MRRLIKLLILSLFFFHTYSAICQGTYDIIEDYLRVIGGKENIDSIKSYHQSLVLSSNGQEFLIEKYFERPFKFKDIILNHERDTLAYYSFDGQSLKSNRQDFLKLSSSPYLKIIKEKRFGLLNRIFYFSNFTSLKDQEVDGISCNVLKSESDGVDFLFYFDKETKFLLKEEDWYEGKLINFHEYLDYKKFGNMVYPTEIRSTTVQSKLTERTLRIEFNKNYEDSFFRGK
ncbi:hypothetical protein EGI22_02615 [Lacihabitans sp. LS3-19]|uniref:outer membrane lipoprotein-sorting protein n=1 Tax=Lacihabitans sp. LS3-19 TaxID=2487335 RepID=UPI0020CFDA80|nr:outer membrane lipoprotein-sorting protein [Lacihabitans sp. LS3-19]MCP9766784.1 hypothetical protein [Lacihabitans sp. LS3-19]